MSEWIVCQIGAREHYAVPRALDREGHLSALLTDCWVKPGSVWARLPLGRRLRDRYHRELEQTVTVAPNAVMLAAEGCWRLRQRSGWDAVVRRNALFQRQAIRWLRSSGLPRGSEVTLFAYSYAALDLLRFAKQQGWRTVLGQIDPGPEEERLVAKEHQRYAQLGSRWRPAPEAYWDAWREEVALADRIIVNSEWSRECLMKEGLAAERLEVVPLVYGEGHEAGGKGQEESIQNSKFRIQNSPSTRVLFLGQINLRKGIGRLLDAMRLLRDEPIELIMAGPCEIDPAAWADLPAVRWVGSVPRSDVEQYYREADVFVLPTLSDGYALTQLEALSHGMPVIASSSCGRAVTDGVNGMLLADLKPATIAEALKASRTAAFSSVQPPAFGLADLAECLRC